MLRHEVRKVIKKEIDQTIVFDAVKQRFSGAGTAFGDGLLGPLHVLSRRFRTFGLCRPCGVLELNGFSGGFICGQQIRHAGWCKARVIFSTDEQPGKTILSADIRIWRRPFLLFVTLYIFSFGRFGANGRSILAAVQKGIDEVVSEIE